MNIRKYFWDLNEKARNETINIILKDPDHIKYLNRMHLFLSRCDKPEVVLPFIGKEQFIDTWPDIRRYWKRSALALDFLAWWETIYEQLLQKPARERPLKILIEIGKRIRRARIKKRLSQNDLAGISHIRQPDISKIEHGRINITLETLYKLFKILEMKHLEINI